MMPGHTLRVGLVGAGKDTRINLIPGFQAIEGVKIVSVANRSRQSSQRVADEFGIPVIYDSWQDLVQAPDTDAICIGTFPDTHYPITLAALERHKHVLCESRMAMNAWEARAMLDASRRKSHLVTQIVPAPSTFQVDNLVLDLINSGYLGELLAADMWLGRSIDNQVPCGFLDLDSPLDWRQDREVHGYNALGLGIVYETLMRWIGPATRVLANSKVFVPRRRGAEGSLRAVELPDHAEAVCDMACGAQAHIAVSQVSGLAPPHQCWLFGAEGTLHVTSDPLSVYGDREVQSSPRLQNDETDQGPSWGQDVHYRDHHSLTVYGAHRGDTALKEIPNPVEKRYRWRVAQEFVRAIHGEEKVTRTPFEVGVQYMEFVEAVACSARTGRAVTLPL